LYNNFGINQYTAQTGSIVSIISDYTYFEAPSYTFTEIANGSGSYVIRDNLITPSLYKLNDIDESGWYGRDFSSSAITFGGVESIFEEVVQPRIENGVTSKHNKEVMYFYESALSASLHFANSWSFKDTDLDNEWDDVTALNRLFFEGCVQTSDTTVPPSGDTPIFREGPSGFSGFNSPPWEIILTSPTVLVTTDIAGTNLDVEETGP
jgi:hypothetical protein